jgi:hypothetical protein
MQLFVAAKMASLSEEIAAKDRGIASLREHVADREGHAAGFQYRHIGDGHASFERDRCPPLAP